jgi:hypothetical protein
MLMKQTPKNKQLERFRYCLLVLVCLIASNYIFDWLTHFDTASAPRQIVGALYVAAGALLLARLVYLLYKLVHDRLDRA